MRTARDQLSLFELQAPVDLFVEVEPEPIVLPENLIDVTKPAGTFGFRCNVAITSTLRELLRPEDGPMHYFTRLGTVLDIAHLQYRMGGTAAERLLFVVSAMAGDRVVRLELAGAVKVFGGQPVLVIGLNKEIANQGD